MSNNPAVSENLYNQFRGESTENSMTIGGTINKTIILLLLAFLGAGAVISQFMLGYLDKVQVITIASFVLAFILSLVIIFVPKTAKYLSPLYAFLEGAALGAISMTFEAQFSGIAVQAITLTFLCLFTMLMLFKTNVVRATERFRAVITVGMLSILAFYIITAIATFFFKANIPLLYDSSPIGIAINLVIVGVAAFSFILDFDNIERGANSFLNKDFEWYFAFSLMVTIVWLYVEMLKLLSRLKDR